MNIPGIQSVQGIQTQAAQSLQGLNLFGTDTSQKTTKTDGASFDSLLQSMMGMLSETDASIKSAEALQLDFATGATDDFVGLTLAMEKANASLNFTIQITNRILEAYKEIMRIQI